MIEIPQYMINWALALLAGVFGWWARQLWDSQKVLAADLRLLELKIAEHYVRSDHMEKLKDEIFAMLRRIEDKIDGKANRGEVRSGD